MAKAQFDVTIEEDGQVTVNTGNLQGDSHHAADAFVKFLQDSLGSHFTIKSTKGVAHHHHHGEQHQHEEA